MLQLSSQVTANLAATMGRFSTRFTTANINGFVQCIVLVSDQLAVPRSSQGVLSFINTVLNASTHGGGSAGNEVYCMGIIDQIPTASYATTKCMSYDGIVNFTAKQTGRIGSAIVCTLYGTSSILPSTIYPIPQSASITDYNTRSGITRLDEQRMFNYSFITDSVGVSGNEMIILDSVDLVAGQTYQFYGASFDFSMVGA